MSGNMMIPAFETELKKGMSQYQSK